MPFWLVWRIDFLKPFVVIYLSKYHHYHHHHHRLIINYKIFQKNEKLKKNNEKLRYQQYSERKKNEENKNEKNENEISVILNLIIHLQCCLLSFLVIRFQIEIFVILNRSTYARTYISDFESQQVPVIYFLFLLIFFCTYVFLAGWSILKHMVQIF
jgi:hypothetical protein